MVDLISKSISAQEPVDLFTLMRKEKAEISIFDEQFIAQLKNMPRGFMQRIF